MERLQKEPLRLTPADFRLAKGGPGRGAGPHGRDLDADVDKLGPGQPYEHWKDVRRTVSGERFGGLGEGGSPRAWYGRAHPWLTL